MSARLRLALLVGALIAAAGTALLVASYFMVKANLGTSLALPRDARIVQDALAEDALHQLKVQYGIALVALAGLSGLAGWVVAGRVLRPVGEIAAAARRVRGDRLGERIGLTDGPRDELRQLADDVDAMLDRLQDSFASQRRFVANASHELRTPLAVMRTELEVTLADPDAPAEELRETAREVRDAVIRAEGLVGALLTLARSEAEVTRREPVDLPVAARHALGDLGAEVAMRGLEVRTDLQPAAACGDRGLLERLVANLVENAVRHNVRGGWLAVRTGTVDTAVPPPGSRGAEPLLRAVVEVRNGGPRIEPEKVHVLTEPFQRLDRGARGDGAGLGLSIVAAVARAHGGDLALEAPPDGGLVARVTLPARALIPDPARAVASEATP